MGLTGGAGVRKMEKIQPLIVDTHTACNLLGIKKTLLFRMLKEGVLERRKLGSKTVIPMESIRLLAERGHS
jgi:hypothetical protein